MPAPMKTGLPPDCVLSAGCIVRLSALDATTGAVVTGVRLSEISVFVTDLNAAGTADGPLGPSTVGPLLVPIQNRP